MKAKFAEFVKSSPLLVFFCLLFIECIGIPGMIFLENIMKMSDDKHIEAFCKLFSLYLLGFRYIGIPMAVASAGFYLWGTDFPRSRWYKVLVYLRDALHPISFVLSSETVQTHLNRRCDYDSPIQTMIGEENPTPKQVIGYIFLSASMWPFRAMLSGGYVSLFLVFVSLSIVLWVIVGIPKGIWFLICWIGKPFLSTKEDYSQGCDDKS